MQAATRPTPCPAHPPTTSCTLKAHLRRLVLHLALSQCPAAYQATASFDMLPPPMPPLPPPPLLSLHSPLHGLTCPVRLLLPVRCPFLVALLPRLPSATLPATTAPPPLPPHPTARPAAANRRTLCSVPSRPPSTTASISRPPPLPAPRRLSMSGATMTTLPNGRRVYLL